MVRDGASRLLTMRGSTLVSRVSLLGPWIAAVVIAADFPTAGLVLSQAFDRLQPFRALPEIKMRHDEPHRAAVLDLQRLSRPAVRKQGVLGGKIFQREIGGV